MAEDGSKQSESVWPLPKFRFEVRFGHVAVAFQEVSGLDVESQPIEYRGGSGAAFSTVKMPGIKKYGNITLKKGVFPKDGEFWAWYVGLVRPCWCAISAPYEAEQWSGRELAEGREAHGGKPWFPSVSFTARKADASPLSSPSLLPPPPTSPAPV